MKRLIPIIFLILISFSVFAQDDFIVGGDNPTNQDEVEEYLDLVQIRSDISKLNKKIDSLQENSITIEDVNGIRDEFFAYGEGMLNYFLAQVLLMLGAVMVFFFVLAFIFKAKKWL